MKLSYALLLCLLASCGGSPMTESLRPERDRTPPVFLDFAQESREEMVLFFDEPVVVDRETLIRQPEGDILVAEPESREVRLRFSPPCEPGSLNTLRLDVADGEGNGNWFLVEFYAPNENQPALVINEISPNGSSTRPDMVEFYVTAGGETTGLTLLLGTEENWTGRYVFPPMNVATGEYILFHCRPEGTGEEVTETGDDLDLSGGIRAGEGVRDLWPGEDMNLSGSNGVLTLSSLPVRGKCLDRIVYTNRTGDGEDKYGGWTAVLWPQIEELSSRREGERGWYFEGDLLFPEDSVWSGSTTSTRTLCRDSLSGDGDRSSDWHTAPTGGCSFGYPNTDEAYAP